MSRPSDVSEQDRQNLIAYLDGELHGAAARSLEARLARNASLRKLAESLRRTWDLLDYLPRPTPSPTFTPRTLSRIAPATTQRMRPIWQRWRWPALAVGWAGSLLLAGWLGYAGSQRLAPRTSPEDELVRDLRIIENKRLYEVADDIDFLRALDRPDLFGDSSSSP